MKKKKLLTLVGSVCLMLVLTALLIPACAKEAPPAPAPAPTPAPAPKEVITVRISDNGPQDPKTNSYWLMARTMFEELDKAFPGQFKLEYYPSKQLYKSVPAHKAVLAGDIEACYSYDSLMMSVFGEEVGNPYMCTLLPIFDDFDQYWKCCMEVGPLLSKEYLEPRGAIAKGFKAGWGGDFFLTKPAYSIADLKGMKLRAVPGAVHVACAEFCGTSPIAMDVSEALAACKAGTVDGIISTFGAGGVRLKFYSVAKYVTPPNIPGISNAGFLMWNLDFWNSLPKEVRDKLDNEILPYAQQKAYKADRLIFDTGWDLMIADGAVRCDWSKEAVDEFYRVAGLPTVAKLEPLIGEKWLDLVKKYAAEALK
ncbi:C4-dicarboxylate-binding periplasmic protein DctP [subsurface metagenome]